MRDLATLPTQQSMKRAHRVRRFRRSNAEHGQEARWTATHTKPWKIHTPLGVAA